MLKIIFKSLFSILQVIIVVPVLYGIGMSGDGGQASFEKALMYGFFGLAVWLLVSIFAARKVFEKFLSDSSQSSKVTKIIVALSPLWIFPAIFCVVVLIYWCLDYYL